MRKRRRAALILALMILVTCCPMQSIAGGGITIDTQRKFDGMEHSFSEGYTPLIQNGFMYLVVPFLSEQEVLNHKITVGVEFQKEENSPFCYKNYQKQVEKSVEGVYLYQCQIQLKEERVNGEYPLRLSVQAQTAEGMIQQEFIIYVEITDGATKVTSGGEPEKPDEQEHPEIPDEPGMPEVPNISEAPIHQPRILIDGNNLQGISVDAGSSNTWEITAKNCSNSQAMENVKVTLLCSSSDISFEKTSWYFQRVGAGGKMDLSQNISVTKKASAEPVSIQLQFEYDDNKGSSYSSAETVALMVGQPQQAEVVNLSFPEIVYESDTNALTFQVQNTGLSVLYNAKVRVEGKGLFQTGELFMGNIEAGTSVDGEMKIFVGTLDMDENGNTSAGGEKYGVTTGTVVFSYEDENGEVIEESLQINTEIKKPQKVELKIEKEKPKTNQWWITIVAGVILVLILLVIWLYLRMQHFKKRVKFHEET